MSLEEFRAYVEKVRSSVPLRSVVEDDTTFNGSGFACCPFHKEKTPSFHLRDGNRYHCFGCGADGDVFAYVVLRDRCSFREAVDAVAKKIGLTWDGGESVWDDPDLREELAKSWDRITVQDVHDRAMVYMHHALPSKVRQWIRETYHFTDELIDERRLGWGNDTLYDYMVEDLDYTDEQLLQSGLFVRTSDGVKPFFDHRVVFPYLIGGRPRYFIGRQTPWTDTDQQHEKGKYKKLLTHSERHPYVSTCVENHWFYNEDDSKGTLERLVITEGITDAISLSMVGVRNISPVTTRFSKKELERAGQLCRGVPRVVICNDSDVLPDGRRPGLEGAISTATYLYEQGIQAFIAELPLPEGATKIDINEFVGKALADGLEFARKKIEGVLAKAKPFVEWKIESLPKDMSAADLNDQLADVFTLISKRQPVERARYAHQISRRFKLPKATVTRQIETLVRNDEREASEAERDERQDHARNRNREDERVRGRVFEDIGFYYVIARDGSTEIISSFTVVPKRLIRYEDDRFLIDSVIRTENGTEYDHVFAHKAWGSKRDFLRDLRHPALQWTGDDNNVQGVLRLLEPEKLKQHDGTTSLGFYRTDKGPRWVSRDVVFGPKGPVDENEITYVDNGAPMADRLRYEFLDAEAEKKLAHLVLPALMQINTPEVVMPCLGWFIASIVKPLIEDKIGHFPVLFVNGTQGSGKTTLLRDVLWPLVGVVKQRDPFSVTDTHFATIRNLSCTNSLVIYFDEYKPGDMNQQSLDRIHRSIRRVYGGEMEIRGRSDQGIEKYRLGAAMVVAGESRPDGDPAILERILSVTPEKTALTPARQEAYVRVTRNDHHRLAAPIIQYVLGRDFDADWENAKTLTDDLLNRIDQGENVPIRCYDNLRCMVLGFIIFESYADHLGVQMPEMDYVSAFRTVVDSVLEGGHTVKDAFDRFMESISTLAHLGLLEPDKHYTIDEETKMLCIHLAACHQVYLTERRRAGQQDETNGLRALRQIAREKIVSDSYVRDVSFRAVIGNSLVRAIAVNQDRVPETLDFHALHPKKESRRYTEEQAQYDWHNN